MVKENEVILGDTHELLKQVEDESVDLIICDGPYGVTQNTWDKVGSIQDYNLELIKRFSSKLKEGGSLYLFGKQNCLDFIDYRPFLTLKTRIVWYQPSRLAQGRQSYTNNYDIIAYFVKGKKAKTFNLEDIRVAQMVELEHRLRVSKVPSVVNGKFGKTLFNEKGKNPGDVWGDIKQLTYKSKELISRETLNTIQKPEKLIERLVLASSNPGDLILDPFAGVGTVPAVAKKLKRRFLAFEHNPEFVIASKVRLDTIENKTNVLTLFDDGPGLSASS
jgi:DNA modification methylase